MPKIKIVPAILSPNFKTINKDLKEIEPYSDLLQVDIMDNIFVPNKTPQAEQLKSLDTKIPLDIHLMVKEPSHNYIMSFINANPELKINNITVHYEACSNIEKTLKFIKKNNIKAGVAINPKTPLEKIKNILDKADIVLIMTVEPGFSGQGFIKEALSKATELRRLKPDMDIEVDGGINDDTAALAAKAGANMFVANSYIFKAKDKAKAIKKLRAAVE
ncbi:ribulose-phosphate 3-epimerase [Candidatus Woesearchaeota archaeon]|nr:ribulose-phosphate 3-epimerase [Candidatus Woesearchaeota archaeon]